MQIHTVLRLDDSLATTRHGSLVIQEIDEHIVTQIVWSSEKSLAFVDLCELFNKSAKPIIGIEHEGIDANLFLRATFHFSQCCLHSFVNRGVIKEYFAARCDVGSGLSIGNHDDLFGARLPRQHFSRKRECVMHVGALSLIHI